MQWHNFSFLVRFPNFGRIIKIKKIAHPLKINWLKRKKNKRKITQPLHLFCVHAPEVCFFVESIRRGAGGRNPRAGGAGGRCSNAGDLDYGDNADIVVLYRSRSLASIWPFCWQASGCSCQYLGSLWGCKSRGANTNSSGGPHILRFWTCLHKLRQLGYAVRVPGEQEDGNHAPGELDGVDNVWGSWRKAFLRRGSWMMETYYFVVPLYSSRLQVTW